MDNYGDSADMDQDFIHQNVHAYGPEGSQIYVCRQGNAGTSIGDLTLRFYIYKEGLNMENLIEALQIMLKHGDVTYPTHCMHDELYIYPNSMDFTKEELARLEELGFSPDSEGSGFYSFKYGSC